MVRLKARYILFEIMYPPTSVDASKPISNQDYLLQNYQSSPQTINTKILLKLIRSGIDENFGSYGSGVTSSNLVLKYFSNQTSTGIVRCSRDYYRLVCAGLSMIGELEGKPCVVRVVKISGTIKKCEMFAMKRNKNLMLRMNNVLYSREVIDIDDDVNDS